MPQLIARHPTRYAGLATIAPQDPKRAVKEMERAIRTLKLNGVMINSHTNGEYLDELKFWPILEAAAGLDVPIYIHPRSPSPAMAQPYRKYHLEHAIWGYAVETGLHAVRLIMSGVFDKYPTLKIVIGHMGENIPYALYRMDWMHARAPVAMDRPKLALTPSEYFRRNFMITTSGVNWHPALKFCIEVLGADNIMWAVDYPYQETHEAVRFMNDAPISDEDKAKIFHRNAERVFRIPAAPLDQIRVCLGCSSPSGPTRMRTTSQIRERSVVRAVRQRIDPCNSNPNGPRERQSPTADDAISERSMSRMRASYADAAPVAIVVLFFVGLLLRQQRILDAPRTARGCCRSSCGSDCPR